MSGSAGAPASSAAAVAGGGGGDDGDGGQVVGACAPCLGSGVAVGDAIPAAQEHRVYSYSCHTEHE